LVDLHERMVRIVGLLTVGTESPLLVRKDEASEEMIKLLGERRRDPEIELVEEVQERAVHAIEEAPVEFKIDQVLERAMEATQEQIRQDAFDRRMRSDELRIVEIEIGRFETIETKPVQTDEVKEKEEPAEISEAVEAVRQRARNAAGELDALVKDAVGGLSEQKETMVRVLAELELGLRGSALSSWRAELSATAELLGESRDRSHSLGRARAAGDRDDPDGGGALARYLAARDRSARSCVRERSLLGVGGELVGERAAGGARV
jgi:hypothetical protein